VAKIDHNKARTILQNQFAEAEQLSLRPDQLAFPKLSKDLKQSFDVIFNSSTQAFREVLLGCLLARMINKKSDIRLPYVSQGLFAFNGRDLDEKVVNPFLKEKQIPSSKGPYLNVFRRQVQFDNDTRQRVRDKAGYDAFLTILAVAEKANQAQAEQILLYTLLRFILLREASVIALAQVHRISLPQYQVLVDSLLETQSGGLMPVLLVVAMFRAIKDTFDLDWKIEFQGINVSDRASGTAGDVIIFRKELLLMAVEVTERPVDKARVVATFRTKIAPQGINDYLFLVNLHLIEDEAKEQAQQYFAQGHEVNFVDLRTWIQTSLAIIGGKGRSFFNEHLQKLLADDQVSRQLKVGWNAAIEKITSL
jgi:hypothetical protein